MSQTNPRGKPSRAETLSEQIRAMSAASKLPGWNSLTETAQVPGPLAAAFATGRPELIRLAAPQALSADECRALYEFIGILLATNRELQLHAQRVAQLTEQFVSTFKGTLATARLIDDFANFRESGAPDESEG
jgi:hypothetical protein